MATQQNKSINETATFGELLYTADTLADAEHYDERDWGASSINLALELCLEAVKEL